MIQIQPYYVALSTVAPMTVQGRPLSFMLDQPGQFAVWAETAAHGSEVWEVRLIWHSWHLDGDDWQFVGSTRGGAIVYHCFARRVS